MTKRIASRSPADSQRLRATITIVRQQSADTVRTAEKQHRRNTRKQQKLKISTKPPLPLPTDHQTDNALKEHPIKDADEYIDKNLSFMIPMSPTALDTSPADRV